ncbi:MAG: hypothetical protein WBG41_00135, partial [Acidimicrobiales bacterium]
MPSWRRASADGSRTLDCPGWTIERGERSIARPLDQMPTESRQLSINRLIMLFEVFPPCAIAG